MPAIDTYDYAVVRVVPRVQREEFINAGVILSCQLRGFLGARIALDVARLQSLAPDVDVDLVQRHLAAIRLICEGRAEAGPIAQLPARGRFHWLTARRSSIIQTSPVHTGRCGDPEGTLDRLLRQLVL